MIAGVFVIHGKVYLLKFLASDRCLIGHVETIHREMKMRFRCRSFVLVGQFGQNDMLASFVIHAFATDEADQPIGQFVLKFDDSIGEIRVSIRSGEASTEICDRRSESMNRTWRVLQAIDLRCPQRRDHHRKYTVAMERIRMSLLLWQYQ